MTPAQDPKQYKNKRKTEKKRMGIFKNSSILKVLDQTDIKIEFSASSSPFFIGQIIFSMDF